MYGKRLWRGLDKFSLTAFEPSLYRREKAKKKAKISVALKSIPLEPICVVTSQAKMFTQVICFPERL